MVALVRISKKGYLLEIKEVSDEYQDTTDDWE